MSNFNLKQLRVFIETVECGSFTGAAKKMYLSQSTVSNHIQGLEDELGVILFQREAKKNIQLTQDGRRVYQYAKDIILRCDTLERNIVGYTDHEVIIGASTVPAQSIIPEFISHFIKLHPETNFSVRNGDSEEIHQMLLDGVIQVGFVGSFYNRKALSYDPVAEDRLVMITPNSPRFAELKKQGALGRDLLSEPLIFREEGSGTQVMVDNYLSASEMDIRNISTIARVSSPESTKELVARDVGVAIISNLAVQEEVSQGKLLQFELEEEPVCRKIYMVYRKKGNMGEMAKEFISYILEEEEELLNESC